MKLALRKLSWLTIALIVLSSAGPIFAGEGEIYIDTYNELVKMINDRYLALGIELGLPLKDAASPVASSNSVTQIDLNNLRIYFISYLERNYVVDSADFVLTTNTVADAFPRIYTGDTAYSIFTKVPAEYTANNAPVTAESFGDVPVLWVHFQEIYDRLLKMKRIIKAWGGKSYFTNKGENNVKAGDDQGVWPPPLDWASARAHAQGVFDLDGRQSDRDQPRTSTTGYFSYQTGGYGAWKEQVYGYFYTTEISSRFSHTVDFYNLGYSPGTRSEFDSLGEPVSQDSWTLWDSAGETDSTTVYSKKLAGTEPRWVQEPTQANPSLHRGFLIGNAVAIVEFKGLYAGKISNPLQNDSDEDGLVVLGKCECSACPPSAEVDPRKDPGTGTRIPLGKSSGQTSGGVCVKAYITEYTVSGKPRQMFSLDTSATYAGANESQGWEFARVKRPSGADVLFSMKGAKAGQPVSMNRSYKLAVGDGGYELRFSGEKQVIHKFNGGGSLAAVQAVNDHQEITVLTGPYNWPMMTTSKSGSRITSNACYSYTAIPTYDSDDLVSSVVYLDKNGKKLSDLSVINGSRHFVTRDANGNLIEETRIITTNNTTEIWYGVDNDNAAKKEIRTEYFDPTNQLLLVKQVNILDSGNSTFKSNENVSVFAWMPWGNQELLCQTNGIGSANPQVTSYAYYTNSFDSNNYSRLRLAEDSSGSWTRYEYDSTGRVSIVYSPFKNSKATAGPNECRTTRTYYAGDPLLAGLNFPANDVVAQNDDRPRLAVEQVAGQEVSRTYHAYLLDRQVTKRCATAGAAYDAAGSLTTTTYLRTNGLFIGRVDRIEHPDGTYTVNNYDFDGELLTSVSATGAGDGTQVTDGTETTTVMDPAGHVVSNSSRDIVSQITISDIAYTLDSWGRVICQSNKLDHTFSTTSYGCCGPEMSTDAEGIQTRTSYDTLKQLFTSTRLGVTTYYTRDVHGNVMETRHSVSNMMQNMTSQYYDQAGLLVCSTNELGFGTSYSYSTNSSGGRLVTTASAPGGAEGAVATRVDSYYCDGQLQSVSGTAVYPVCYDFGVDAGGAYTIEYKGADTSAAEWTRTYTDLLGRTIREERPGSSSVPSVSSVVTNLYTYNSKGQLIRQSESDNRQSLTDYNSKGEAFRTAVDMDGNSQIDLDGPDRISETESGYTTFNGKDVRQTISKTYPTNNSSSVLTLSTSLSSVNNSESWSVSFGRTNHIQIIRDRANAARTEIASRPDGTQTISVYTNGLLRSVTEKRSDGLPGSTRNMAYDVLNRPSSTTEPAANGETRTTVNGYNAAGAVTSVTVSAGALSQTTTHEFDAMGRRIRTILPDNGVVNYGYNLQGALTNQSGARTYPVTYSYTDQGRLASMSTYRSGPSGPADVTAWQYDPARGWLTSKVYADGSVNGYSYFANGALQKRNWARGVKTTYNYDNAGSLTNISYSDGTPGVSYTLDRLGRAVEIRDAVGTWTNKFNEDGTLASESTGGPGAPPTVIRSYDSLARLTNISLSIGGSRSVATMYSFDLAGRISTVSDGASTATYTYGPDGASGATGEMTWTNLSFGSALNTRRTFDGLNRLTSVINLPSASSATSARYSYNQANQKTTNTLADASEWRYTYDSLGQVISGRKYSSAGQPVQGAQFEYNFDTIGNRTLVGASLADARSSAYTANNLNQYTQRTVPGVVNVAGDAGLDATVSVRLGTNNAVAVNRDGKYFWKELEVDNSFAIFSTTNLKVTAYMAQGSNSLVRTETVSAKVPMTPERFTWDADGNLLSDGLWTNTWNGENRLIAMESLPSVPDIMKKRLIFQYDYLGRRVSKKIYSWGADHWSLITDYSFVWDGWNLISELCASVPLSLCYTNSYTWGLDLSGTLQGAGGVGGLLFSASSANSARNFFVYDGNGNVTGLVDTNGVTVAEYEYSPFGETLKATGNIGLENKFRFSTKYTDSETGLLSYGYRYYYPTIGRWIGRDPIQEEGGENLYVFCGNEPMNKFDVNGLYLVAIDGTGSADWSRFNLKTDKFNSHVANFYKDYKGHGRFWEGPNTVGGGVSATVNEAYGAICEALKKYGNDEPLFLVGHSRGGFIAILVAQKLKDKPCDKCKKKEIDFLGLYDAVDMYMGADANIIPDNVKFTAHGRRDLKVGSRTSWGNTGTSGSKKYEQDFFYGTHSAMGGDPWKGDHPKTVTKEQDEEASKKIDSWIRTKAKANGVSL